MMIDSLQRHQFSTVASASTDQIERLQLHFGRLPTEYVRLLQTTNGFANDESVTVYRAEEVIERNQTFDVQKRLPDMLTIGDDNGGRAILLCLADTMPVYLAGHSALQAEWLEQVAPTLEAWIEAGCPIDCEETTSSLELSAPEFVDVVIYKFPPGGARSLLSLKNTLSLPMGIGELKSAAENSPAVILKHVPFWKYRSLCARVENAAEYLKLVSCDDPAVEYLISESPKEGNASDRFRS